LRLPLATIVYSSPRFRSLRLAGGDLISSHHLCICRNSSAQNATATCCKINTCERHHLTTYTMPSEARKTRRNGKRPAAKDSVEESSKTAEKRACKTGSQSQLPFARPPPSSPSTQSQPATNTTPCLVDNSTDEEPLVEKTIRADERIDFELDWALVADSSSYRIRQAIKRQVGSARISFIYKHGLQLERKLPNGQYSKIF